jgi:hypothetical protein
VHAIVWCNLSVSLPVFKIIEEMQTNSPEVTVCIFKFVKFFYVARNTSSFVLKSVYAIECNYPKSIRDACEHSPYDGAIEQGT